MRPCSSRAYKLTKLFRNYPLTIYLAVKKKSRRNNEQIPSDIKRFLVCDQMALCNPVPDFNSEEVTSVARSKTDIFGAVEDMAEHLPKEDPGKGDIVILELQMKVKRRLVKISHSQRRPHVGYGLLLLSHLRHYAIQVLTHSMVSRREIGMLNC